MTEESIHEKLQDPYRIRCPEGHARITERVVSETKPTVYCDECGMAYRIAELIDMREYEPPVPMFR